VFRYEEPEIVKLLIGDARFKALMDKGYATDKNGRFPIVYQFDMRNPDSFITGQTFPVKNRDVIYASRHPTVDIQRFLSLVSQPVGVASGVITLSE
jgi:polysaccharide biosynthesis/export protein